VAQLDFWTTGLYGFVQKHYWGIGFLSFWDLRQLPNFALAAPMLLLVAWTVREYVWPRGTTSVHPKPLAPVRSPAVVLSALARIALVPIVPFFALAGVTSMPDVMFRARRNLAPIDTWNAAMTPRALPYVAHAAFLAVFALCLMHVQVATRFLAAASPVPAWGLAVFVAPRQNCALSHSHHCLGIYRPGHSALPDLLPLGLTNATSIAFPIFMPHCVLRDEWVLADAVGVLPSDGLVRHEPHAGSGSRGGDSDCPGTTIRRPQGFKPPTVSPTQTAAACVEECAYCGACLRVNGENVRVLPHDRTAIIDAASCAPRGCSRELTETTVWNRWRSVSGSGKRAGGDRRSPQRSARAGRVGTDCHGGGRATKERRGNTRGLSAAKPVGTDTHGLLLGTLCGRTTRQQKTTTALAFLSYPRLPRTPALHWRSTRGPLHTKIRLARLCVAPRSRASPRLRRCIRRARRRL
jgi:phosphatidylinositol glycan class V